jgi:hypothetical protein
MFLPSSSKHKGQGRGGNATVAFRPESGDLAAEVKGVVFVKFQMNLNN